MSIIDKVKDAIGADPTADADPDMHRVLEALATLGAKPVDECETDEARHQPGIAEAVALVMQEDGITTAPGASVTAEDIQIDGAQGPLAGRIYRPATAHPSVAMPVILYFHGGGWVIGSINGYDASARALAEQANAIVVSADYRQAPEHKFPAAHDDANAAYEWLLSHATSFGGDPDRVAVAGESAGANLAINVARYAVAQHLPLPAYQVVIYPVAANDLHSESYHQNSNAKPLSRPMMRWFIERVVRDENDVDDPRIDLVNANLEGLPPAMVVTAGIDPLRSDGEKLARALQSAGVLVEHHDYPGVTHEFFSMGAVVEAARDAQRAVATNLVRALAV